MPEPIMLTAIHEKVPKAPANEAKNIDPKWPLNEFMGIEIETEDFAYVAQTVEELAEYWTRHDDGSLRNGTEWVTRKPFAGKQLTAAVDGFFGKRRAYNMSERTSVHLHINMTNAEITVDQFRSLFCLAYVIDPAVFRIADENRKWCSYCCPLSDMGEERLSNLLSSDKRNKIMAAVSGDQHEDKYYGFNIVSLKKHGTLEFRHFACTQDKDQMESWIVLVQEIKKAGISFDDPKVMLEMMQSGDQIAALLRAKMPKSAASILQYLDRDDAVQRAARLLVILNNKPIQEQRMNHAAAPAYDRLKQKLAARRNNNRDLNDELPKPYVKKVVAAAAPNDLVIKKWREALDATVDQAQRDAILMIIAGLEARN